MSANKEPDELSHSFDRLTLVTNNPTTSKQLSSPSLSPLQSPSQNIENVQSHMHHEPPGALSRNHPTPRRIPSSASLKSSGRESTPSLQKKSSVSSLRSVKNSSTSPRPSLSRRSSSALLTSPAGTMRPKSPLTPPDLPPQPVIPTASSIAADYFKEELATHQSTDLQSKTLIVIQDACYGHRFSRPRTSKASLDLIVERPERLRASVLGLSTAYTRIAGRHEGGRFAPHPDLDPKGLPTPPFQIRKTSKSMPLNSAAVTHVHGNKWMEELKAMCEAAESRLASSGKELVRPNSSGKDDGSANQRRLHEGDLYLCPESLNAFEGALGGVCEGIDSVFTSRTTRRAFVCIRPPGHHCSSNYPSGFCWLNNVHVGITHAAMAHGLTHAAIIDFDLHHGDGSQAIAWEQNRKATSAHKNAAQHKKTSIGYFSLHDINSYPCEGGDEDKVRNASVCIENAHGQSVWNVHLEPWKSPSEFWQLYSSKYLILIEKARAFLRLHTQRLLDSPNGPQPKAAIFISAGFDASEWEGAGMQRHKVNVPTDFYAKFTADVVKLAEEQNLCVDGRVISVLEGGYSDRALLSGVLSHVSGLADTRGAAHTLESQCNGLASDMSNRLGLIDNADRTNSNHVDPPIFDTGWWSIPLLEELERLAYPQPELPARKPRGKNPPTYTSPTQASTAKVVTPTRERRYLSSQQSGDDTFIAPPLPPVDWATAAHEMSKALIPTDRQTMSCQHADLKVEPARTKRDRHTAANASELRSVGDRKHMQLRERKTKTSGGLDAQISGSSSRSQRRTTIAAAGDLPETPAQTPNKPAVSSGLEKTKRIASGTPHTTPRLSGMPVKDENTRNVPSRPSSRGRPPSSRPGSSKGMKKDDSLAAKKPRETTTSRPPLPNNRSSPKKRPTTASGIIRDRSPIGSKTEISSSLPANGGSKNSEIESLAAGVRKLNIKLKVPSPEENAARERKLAEERKKNVTGKPQTPRAPKTTTTTSTEKTSRANSVVSTSPSVESTDPVKPTISPEPLTQFKPSLTVTETPPASSSLAPQPWLTGATQSSPGPMETETPHNEKQFVSRSLEEYNGDNSPDPLSKSPPVSARITSHPQITVKPPPLPASRNKDQLPVFTSTSAIPFGPPRRVSQGEEPKRK